jgi:hypothetical protein
LLVQIATKMQRCDAILRGVEPAEGQQAFLIREG